MLGKQRSSKVTYGGRLVTARMFLLGRLRKRRWVTAVSMVATTAACLPELESLMMLTET